MLLSLFFVVGLGWGLMGVAAGTLVARILVRSAVHAWYTWREAGSDFPGYVFMVITRAGGAGILVTGWYMLVRNLFAADNWPLFVGQITLALVGYVPIALFILVPPDDRKRLLKVLRRAPVEVD